MTSFGRSSASTISPNSHVSHNQGNERVSRDVLEFKRLRNKTAKANERDIERTILRLVDEEMELRKTEPDYYQDFLVAGSTC